MRAKLRVFAAPQATLQLLRWGDAVVLAGLGAIVYFAVQLGIHAPEVIPAQKISRSTRSKSRWTI